MGCGMAEQLILTTSVVHELAGKDAATWDAFVANADQSDVSQLQAWSRIRAAAGFSPAYVLVREGQRLVAGAQVLTRRLPVVGLVGYVSSGPLIATDATCRETACKTVCDALATFGRSLRMLFVQPPVGVDRASAELGRLGFRPSDTDIAPAASLRIDLRVSEDKLRSRLDRRLQKWTRQWQKRGVSVRVGDETDLPFLASLFERSAEHHEFKPVSLDYLRRQYSELARGGHSVLFVGEVDKAPVAVALMTCSGGMMRERLAGFDRTRAGSNLSVASAVTWNAMLWAREHGLSWYDLGGFSPEIARSMLRGNAIDLDSIPGPDRYKMKFGGEPYLMPQAMEFGRPQLLLSAYELAQRSRSGRAALYAVGRKLRGGHAAVGAVALRYSDMFDGTWELARLGV